MKHPQHLSLHALLVVSLVLFAVAAAPVACRCDESAFPNLDSPRIYRGQGGAITVRPGLGGQYTLRFEPRGLAVREQGDYVRISLPGCESTTEPGQPQLPAQAVRIYVPPGKQAVGVRTSYAAPIELYGNYLVWPAQPPVPISSGGQPGFVPPDSATYSSLDPYPGELAHFLGTGSLSGHRLADVVVLPVQYVPAKRKLTLYTEITLSLVLEDCEAPQIAQRSPRTERLFADAARGIVINPEEVAGSVARSGCPNPLNGEIVEYLIITDDLFAEDFEPLAQWKTEKGIPAQVVTTSAIYSSYPGADEAEKIRNCIKDYWLHKGLAWVLLAGDVSVVPTRFAFAMQNDYGDQIPCDLYFSDLDRDWNADGDSAWGEYPEDQVDMYCDVYLGRATIDRQSHVERFVRKVLQYEGEETYGPPESDYQLKALFLASLLDEETDSADLKDAVDNESFCADWDPITKLYESYANLTTESAMTELDSGYNIVNHDGHGNTAVIGLGGEHYLSYDEIGALANAPRFTGVFLSCGCFTCEFPASDCIAEWFLLIQDGGGFYVGNTRYGWYYVGAPASGLTARLDRSFFDQLFNRNKVHLGQAYGEGKNKSVTWAKEDPYDRYCLYEFTLLGDPEVQLWTGTPESLGVNHPEMIGLGYTEFAVDVSCDGSPLEGATVCLDKEGDFNVIAETDSTGRAVFELYSSSPGEAAVTVTSHNCVPYQGDAQVLGGECTATAAPTPQPDCGGPLFGRPESGYPGWAWFSIPLHPANCCGVADCCDPSQLLLFDASRRAWEWDKYGKCYRVHRPPFSEFRLWVGMGYLAYLQSDIANPSYSGIEPGLPFEEKLGSMGWTWIGKPGDHPLSAGEFGDRVSVRYPSSPDGDVRTAAEDSSSPAPWLSWEWGWFDTWGQAFRTFAPFSGGPESACHPWLGYRVYVQLGSASTELDQDQVTLIWGIGD